jgi:hypothetical protein
MRMLNFGEVGEYGSGEAVMRTVANVLDELEGRCVSILARSAYGQVIRDISTHIRMLFELVNDDVHDPRRHRGRLF